MYTAYKRHWIKKEMGRGKEGEGEQWRKRNRSERDLEEGPWSMICKDNPSSSEPYLLFRAEFRNWQRHSMK